MDITHLCDKTVTIQENSGTQDGQAQRPEDWGTKYANVMVRIVQNSAAVMDRWEGTPAIGTHTVYVADGALTITEQDRVLYGTRIFQIIGVRNPDELDVYLIIHCDEIK